MKRSQIIAIIVLGLAVFGAAGAATYVAIKPASSATPEQSQDPDVITEEEAQQSERYGQFGAPDPADDAGSTPTAAPDQTEVFKQWSQDDQEEATDLAWEVMGKYIAQIDEQAWHESLANQTTDRFKTDHLRFDPSYTTVTEVTGVESSSFTANPHRAVISLATDKGVWQIAVTRENVGAQMRVDTIAPTSAKEAQ
ncbi:hypothetical protein NBM05_03805 [Rothia sp. AR01]|uniref:Uncharacterized protein n=1 Tax=Rothia santali TaxID=2949643 RepID=A0A9X2HJ22_9MICC|nr:hypothetical protein [Rothia santali]MCP3425173.1 hypothetical protein [Rothia santali]